MTYVRQLVENAAIGVAVIDDADHFSVLRRSGVAATIWRRQMQADFQAWIDRLEPEKLPSVRGTRCR